MIKLTREMKSRILSEHVAGKMAIGGYDIRHGNYCINQVALGFVNVNSDSAYSKDCTLANLFDNNYKALWTPEQMLQFVETRGKRKKY